MGAAGVAECFRRGSRWYIEREVYPGCEDGRLPRQRNVLLRRAGHDARYRGHVVVFDERGVSGIMEGGGREEVEKEPRDASR